MGHRHLHLSLADLQAAYHDGHASEVASALLGAPVRATRKPRKVLPPEEIPGQHTAPSATQQVLPVLGKPADWPYRIRPEDVERMAYEAARDALPPADKELVRLACGLSSNATPDNPRFPLVASVVMRCRKDVLRDLGYVDGRIRSQRKPKRSPLRTEAPCSEVVTRDAEGCYWSEDGEPLTEVEAWVRVTLVPPDDGE